MVTESQKRDELPQEALRSCHWGERHGLEGNKRMGMGGT